MEVIKVTTPIGKLNVIYIYINIYVCVLEFNWKKKKNDLNY